MPLHQNPQVDGNGVGRSMESNVPLFHFDSTSAALGGQSFALPFDSIR